MRQPHTRFLESPVLVLAISCALGTALVPACSNSGGGDGNGGEGGEGGEGAEGGGSGGKGGNKGGSGGNNGGSGGTGNIVAVDGFQSLCTDAKTLAPAPVRRLAKTEYLATLRDLFPKTITPDADGVWRIDNHSFTIVRNVGKPQKLNLEIKWTESLLEDPNTFGFQNRAKNLNPTAALIENRAEHIALFAEHVVNKWLEGTGDSVTPCSEKTVDCGKQWIDQFGPRVFRRPMTDAEKGTYKKYFEDEFNEAKKVEGLDAFAAAVQLTIELLLQSPQFQYRLEFGGDVKDGVATLGQFEIANRLSYLLYSSMPDQKLWEAAEKGELKTPEQIGTQAERMMKEPRFRFMAIEFFRQWGDVEKIFSESYRRKPGRNLGDPKHPYPIWYVLGARGEVERLAEWLMTEGDGSVNTLLTTTKTWQTSFTKALYAGSLVSDTAEGTPDWNYVAGNLDATKFAGWLTRAHFNWTHSRFDTPSPPLRGSFVMSKLLCTHFPPPPGDALSQPVKLDGLSSNRARFEARVKARNDCPGCHTKLDGIGFTFESYSEVGAYIANQNTAGNINFGIDADGPVANAVELSKKLGDSVNVRQCMLKQWYEYATGRDADTEADASAGLTGVDQCRLDALDKVLASNSGDIRKALLTYVKSADFVKRPAAQ